MWKNYGQQTKRDCNCPTYQISGIQQHTAGCASWENERCGYCGTEKAEELNEVHWRGSNIKVCQPCFNQNFTV